jgi:hypothetical protein
VSTDSGRIELAMPGMPLMLVVTARASDSSPQGLVMASLSVVSLLLVSVLRCLIIDLHRQMNPAITIAGD